MKIKALITGAIFSIFSSYSYSEVVIPKGVGCDTESGQCFIILTTPFQNTNCTNNGQLRMNPDKKGTTGQYSAALAAFMAGKKLEVGSVSCYNNHPTPSYLYVIN